MPLLEHHNVDSWVEAHKAEFAPPVCNRLMHRHQLSVMFVGGPNTRTDFHLDHGSEFFFQVRGRMELPTIQRGQRVKVDIGEGQVFLLPSRIPHSPQRPVENSLGLVVERSRDEATEKDGLRWYTDFEKADRVLWEKYFHCGDLGRDLLPVVNEYKQSEEFKTHEPTGKNIVPNPPLIQDTETVIPAPFDFWPWVERDDNAQLLADGGSLSLFPADHPDGEIKVMVVGGESSQTTKWKHETWLWQLRGSATITTTSGESKVLGANDCVVVTSDEEYTVTRSKGSIGLVVTQDPTGNNERRRRQEAEWIREHGKESSS